MFLTGVDYRIYYNEVSIQGNYNDRKVGWKGWTEVGGTTDAPVSADGDMIIAKGVGDKRIYQNARSGGTWSGWKEVDGGGSTDVALTSAYNVLFAKGVDDQRIYANALNDTWTGWKEVPGGGTTDAALYATYHVPSRSILLFAKGVGDNGIYVNRLQNDLSDGKWEPVSGTTDASPAATVPNVVLHGDIEAWSHAVHVFAKGVADGRIYHNFALSL